MEDAGVAVRHMGLDRYEFQAVHETLREGPVAFHGESHYAAAAVREVFQLLRVVRIAGEIKEKSKDRSTLLSEKKATPAINILKHRDLSRRIAELTEELEELRSEKTQLLASMEYASDTPLSAVRKDVAAIEANLKKLEQQEQRYTAELNTALSEYEELKAQAGDFDPDELAMAQLAIRPEKEAAVQSKVRETYGDKYDFWAMIGAEKDVSRMLNEEDPHSIRERVRRKGQERQRENREPVPQHRKKDRGWER